MFAEFPYKYIIFKQTPNNFMLLAGWALQFPTALERGLYQPVMYFKKTKSTENNPQGDLIIFDVIHPVNSIPYRLIKVDLYDFEQLLPNFEQLEDKEYLDPIHILGNINEEGVYTNYFLDKYYTSLFPVKNLNNRQKFYDYILNRNK